MDTGSCGAATTGTTPEPTTTYVPDECTTVMLNLEKLRTSTASATPCARTATTPPTESSTRCSTTAGPVAGSTPLQEDASIPTAPTLASPAAQTQTDLRVRTLRTARSSTCASAVTSWESP